MDLGLAQELQARGIETIEELQKMFDRNSLAELERPWGGKRMEVGEAKSEHILAGARAFVEGRPIFLAGPDQPLDARVMPAW